MSEDLPEVFKKAFESGNGKPPPKKKERPPKQEPEEPPGVELQGFAEGVAYMASRFWGIFQEDPITAVEVMVAVNMTARGATPPKMVECYYSAGRIDWRDQLKEIKESWRMHGPSLPHARIATVGAGRPGLGDDEWVQSVDEE